MINPATIVRCPIHGSIPIFKIELEIIDSIYFQRLRYISQLGFASYVYPGAVHSRFSHSLGVMHLASKIYDQVLQNTPQFKQIYSTKNLKHYKKILRLSAMLHDIGHPPFSHSAEEFLPHCSDVEGIEKFVQIEDRKASHEDFSVGIIAKMLEEKKINLSEDEFFEIIYLITGEFPPKFEEGISNDKKKMLQFLSQIISGEIDADRMDYLLRDSYYAGVTYGTFDLNRLIQYLTAYFDIENDRIHLSIHEKAILSYDDFLLARAHMFIQVYYHKTLSSFEHYMSMAFREKEILFDITGDISSYVRITEDEIRLQFRKAIKKTWSHKILLREPAKTIYRKIGDHSKYDKEAQDLVQKLKENGINPVKKILQNVFSSQFDKSFEDKKTLAVKTISLGNTTFSPIKDMSPLLANSGKNIKIVQLFVLREEYKKTKEILQT